MAAMQGRAGWRFHWRAIALLAAPIWLALVSVAGFRQAPWPDPLDPPGFLSHEWWLHPFERHASLRLPLVGGVLHDLHVSADGRQIWAVGSDGLILHSADAGGHWVRQVAPPEMPLADMPPPAPAKGAWLPVANAIAAEPPASKKEAAQSPAQADYNKDLIQAPSGGLPELKGGGRANAAPSKAPSPVQQQGIPKAAVPKSNAAPPLETPPRASAPTVSNTAPANQASAPAASTPPTSDEALRRPTLESVFFLADNKTGWIAGSAGTLLQTTDGGAHWRRELGPDFHAPLNWIAIAYRESGEGWLVSREGRVMHRAPGGSPWQERARFAYTVSRAWIDPATGRLLCERTDGRLVSLSDNGGSGWREEEWSGSETARRQLVGGLLMSDDEGFRVDYSTDLPPPGVQAYAILARHAVGVDLLLIVAPASIVRMPASAAKSGTRVLPEWLTQPPGAHLRDIVFRDSEHATATGFGGQRYVSNDSGRDWTPEGAGYARYPAPWVWLAWFAGFVTLTGAALRPPPPPTTKVTETIADAFASDKPLAAVRDDRLDFAPRAWGLSAFLRNERTEAPLTIAITGDWGSGKSSLMGLLREDLARFGVKSVWFNAWHHQKEEALLAALLSAIRDEAIPGWTSLEGIEYRLRLLWKRGRRYWLLSLAVAFSIGLFGWALTHPGSALDNWFALADDLWRALVGDAKNTPPESDLLAKLRAAGLAAGALAPLATALVRLRAFGVDPGALAASVSKGASIRDLGVQASFRQRFASEFAEVTAALEPRTMLVLIDDLDRCRPEAVLEVMEAVNFLVSSGRVFVVLGMARERVEACVGLAFEKVAQEMVESEVAHNGAPEEDQDQRARRVRREYARQYLEKLINIEMPMPQLDPQASRKLQDEAPPPGDFEWPLWLRRLGRLWPIVVGIGAILLGAWLGSRLPAAVSHGAAPPPPPASSAPADVNRSAPTGVPASGPVAEPAQMSYFAPAAGGGSGGVLDYCATLAVLTLALLVVAALRRPDPVVRDSPAFRDALAIWNPVVASALRTPRAVKRYQNWVRYLAMMQRSTRRTPTLRDAFGQRLARLLGRTPDPGRFDREIDSSPELVALGALERVLPGGIGNDELTSRIAQIDRADLRSAVRSALDAHAARFDLAALKGFLPRFRQLARGVRMEAPPEGPTVTMPSAATTLA
jgi:photosystem II stability/assembly factor-like uncharacterized protein